MERDDGYYMLYLEDFRYPRTTSKVRAYYGSMEEIQTLMAGLSEDEDTAIRYGDTIDALENYPLDHNIIHWMAGRQYPLLTPVEEVCRFDSHEQSRSWEYRCKNGSVYSLMARELATSQILVRRAGVYERCVKVSFTRLEVGIPIMGWFSPSSRICGFPGIFTWNRERRCHTMHFYVCQQTYREGELEQAMEDVIDPGKIDLNQVMGDILGEA